jgi:chondroitin AC lyase
MKTVIDRLKVMNAPRDNELTDFYNFLDGKSEWKKPGNRHFWKADMMVQHGADFHLSVRVPSSRTTGTEKVSGENLKRKYLPWGATNIMVSGDEYVNIFPAWDWSRIPGVTTAKDDVIPEKPEASQRTINTPQSTYYFSSADFAGGVSDGVFGLSAYDYSWDSIRGRKAWFFTPEAMYCFGAGIEASKSKPIITNVNQCLSSGQVTVNVDGEKSIFEGSEMTRSDIRWAHHDRVGYFFPSGGDITLKNADQSGSYNELVGSSRSSSPVTLKVFSLWIDHGNSPAGGRYEYIVVPSKDVNQFEKWLEDNPLKMIINDNNYQAVHDRSSGVFAVAFYRAGTITLEQRLSVLVSRPCLLLIQSVRNGAGYKITVSDPTTKIQNVILKISKTLKGPDAIINPDQSTSISIIFPSGDNAGRSLTMEFLNETSTSAGIENFKPGPLPNYY